MASDKGIIRSGGSTRRSIIATSATGVAIATAGCAGDGNGGETPTGANGNPRSSRTDSGGESSPESTIPGQVVHNGLKGVGVTGHWYDGEFLHIQIRNERSEALGKALDKRWT